LPHKLSRRTAGTRDSGDNERAEALLGAQVALEVALDAIECPAFIVDQRGDLVRANAVGRHLLERDGVELVTSLAKGIAGGLPDRRWELKPLRCPGNPPRFLALLRPPAPEPTAERPAAGVRLDDVILRASRLWNLTRRQREVLELLAHGLTNASVAETLEIGDRAVEYHVSAIFEKTGAENRAMLLAKLFDL
jgi:DNA-binding NarL/FixJ family response regulator